MRIETGDDPVWVEIKASYAPYDTLPAFYEGVVDYGDGNYANPYDGRHEPGAGVAAQAWDRGLEAASRWSRAIYKRTEG
jgi:hypothetical protein